MIESHRGMRRATAFLVSMAWVYYCAVGNKGRCIGLITSKRLGSGARGTGPN
jgi:hypothetical protein